jgi:tripartite-type tricarboxylate transporter receptor subunit TctC
MSGLGYPANVTGAPAARNHLKEVAMKTLLSFFVLGLLSLSLLPAEAQRVAAVEAYPTKPVKVIVPRPPGNANDLIARVLVQKLSESMRGQFYVENLPAGGGIVGMATAASAPADGHTILAANQDLIVHPLVKGKVPYDPFTSFAPVSLVASAPEVIVVHPSVPAKTIGELVALLKANPGKYSYASPGHGTSPHVACERLFRITHGVDVVHVPFPGGGQAVQSTLAGHTAILHITLPLIAEHIKDGSLRALALASSTRSPLFPDLPTLAEAGVPNHEVAFWVGVLVPVGTPSSRIDALHQQITRIESLADVKERFASIGFEPIGSTPAQFAARLKSESAEWARVVREARINID